ncbi:MAG: hypothetical protein HYX87_02100 [Chloroflexi bacterium]|nr:hypothetical protein [Chloroflexota bacterium]
MPEREADSARETRAALSPPRRRPVYKRTLFWIQVVLVIGLVIGAWTSLRSAMVEPDLGAPTHIGDLKRVDLLTGEAALQQMRSMHSGDIGITDGYLANYQASGEKMTLWVGIATKDSEAEQLLQRMVSAIGKGGTPFSKPTPVTVDGRQVFYTTGSGGVNYFLRDGHRVVWVMLINSAIPANRLTDVMRTVKSE